MREISPAVNATPEEYLRTLSHQFREIVALIRTAKKEGRRLKPSGTLQHQSKILTTSRRAALVDKIASLVDENLTGRSDMCEQFAVLLALALSHLGIPAQAVTGEAIYYGASGAILFRWPHTWARAGDEVIDGNVDILLENPVVPKAVTVAPYWGPISATPRDRKLRAQGGPPAQDSDVQDIWWPELRAWLDDDFQNL